MKIKVEIEKEISEPEVVIKCSELNQSVLDIQRALSELISENQNLVLKDGETEYFAPVKDLLFFETKEDGSGNVVAHTADSSFSVDYKLYELEKLLPSFFMRVSKSTILNTRFVYGITRNLTASSRIEFQNSKKIVYVSRNYYKSLVNRLTLDRMRFIGEEK